MNNLKLGYGDIIPINDLEILIIVIIIVIIYLYRHLESVYLATI